MEGLVINIDLCDDSSAENAFPFPNGYPPEKHDNTKHSIEYLSEITEIVGGAV